jgi:hypothetical protein
MDKWVNEWMDEWVNEWNDMKRNEMNEWMKKETEWINKRIRVKMKWTKNSMNELKTWNEWGSEGVKECMN